jgi:MFS family permease
MTSSVPLSPPAEEPFAGHPGRLGRLLIPYPRATAAFYTVVCSLLVALVGTHAVRLQKDLGFGTAELGYMIGTYFVAAALGSMTLGPLVDRFGTRIGFRLASVGTAFAAISIVALARNWVVAALVLAIAGISNTVAQLTGNRLVARRVASGSQGSGFAAKQAAIPLSTFLAASAAWLIGADKPWRLTFIAFAVIALAAAALSPGFPSPLRATVERARERTRAATSLMALAVAGGMGAVAANTLSLLVVDAFSRTGFSEAAAAQVATAGSAAAIFARLGVGQYVDRHRTPGYLELTVMMAIGAVGFLLLSVAGEARPVLFCGVLLGFAAGWGWPAVIYFTAAHNSPLLPASATAFVLSGVYTGTVVGPIALGSIAAHLGYPVAWSVGGASLLVAASMVQLSRHLAHGSNADDRR